MPKLIYLLRRPASVSERELVAGVLDELAPRLLSRDPDGLKVSVSEPGGPRPWHLPVKHGGLALVAIWSQRDAAEWTAEVARLGWPLDGYRVSESAPRVHERAWPDGERTPGHCMLTLFRKRRALSQAEFVRRWHEGHSPMALRTHPLVGYVRNVVEEPLTSGAAPWGGIVEEQLASARDLIDPRRFYGGALLALPRLLHVVQQTSTFLHLPSLENHILGERWLRAPP